MEIALAFASFAALLIVWTAIERRRVPPRHVAAPIANSEPTRHGFLRRIA
jgi:hypothetical protein